MNGGVQSAESADRSNFPLVVASAVLAIGTVVSFVAYRVLVEKEARLVQEQLNTASEHRVRVLEKGFRR